MPEVSIVIRTFNEERHLPVLFDALESQTMKDFETVVVDSGSFDRTREIASDRGARLVRISSHDFTFGYSLNVGVKAATAPFIVMVSAHTEPASPSWLAKLTLPLRSEKTAMVAGRQMCKPGANFAERMDFERMFGPAKKDLAPPNFFVNNANSAVRRELWEKHPFDESLPGLEDIEWAKHWLEKGYRVVYEPEAPLYHIHDESWIQIRRRFYREGQAAKWMGVIGRRSLARQALGELFYCFQDWLEALKTSNSDRLGEIARYRIEKVRGRTAGVWSGAAMDNPLKRERMLFDRDGAAVVIRGPGKAALENVPLGRPGPGDALIRVAFEGICGTDLEILEGTLGYFRDGLASYPITPGHELSGTVVSVGPRVEGIREGDRVVVECIQGCGDCEACKRGNPLACAARAEVGVMRRDGGYAEYMTTPGRFVHKVPDGLSLKQAALAEPLAVVLKGLKRLESAWGREGKRKVAVIGGGPIGQLAARLLVRRGHDVTAFETGEARRGLFKASGIRAEAELAKLGSFDAFVEATGNHDALDKALHESKAGAVALLLGLPYGRREFNFETIVGFEKTVVGSLGSGPEEFEEALALLPSLDTVPFLKRVLPLAEFEKAWELARDGGDAKILLQADPLADK